MSLEPTGGARNFTAVLAEGIRISGKVWGKAPQRANEPIRRFLCLHGWLDNANTWDLVVPKLEESYGDSVSFLALDFAGHGWSDLRSENDEYPMHRYVFDILQIVDLLGWDQFGILGHSMGGEVGLLITGCFPDRVNTFISVDILGPVSFPLELQPDVFHKAMIDRLAFSKRSSKPLYVSVEEAAVARASTGEISLEAARILTDRGVVLVPGDKGDRWTWRTDQKLRIFDPGTYSNDAVLEMIRRVKAKMLVVLAPTRTGSGEIIDSRVAVLGNKGTVVRMENAQHHLHLEKETVDDFIKVLRTFLEEKVWKEDGKSKARL
ncbi:Alpha/Beta hydrolase protein [Cladochytrium replicatum]|nr:Alpha/Beta hydrolase protein [Cladochytrium replicatum]